MVLLIIEIVINRKQIETLSHHTMCAHIRLFMKYSHNLTKSIHDGLRAKPISEIFHHASASRIDYQRTKNRSL